MGQDLTNRHFVKELDFTPEEWMGLVGLAQRLKAARVEGREERMLVGKTIALIFEKTSTRTRCAFEVAAYHLGAQLTYLDPHGSQIGHKESFADTGRVLGRLYDAIEFRGSRHADCETLAQYAGVPVYNGLTDTWHPTQALCDIVTMVEHTPKPAEEIAYAYVGDARYNMGNSLLISGAMSGMDVRIVAPRSLWPAPEIVAEARSIAERTGARVSLTESVEEGVSGVDFVHTDVWVSMGEAEHVWAERIALLTPYAVTADVMRSTGNPGTKFMHCLPSFHNRETSVGERIYQEYGLESLEVTDEVFESPASIVFDQSENRMHTIKAVLAATLCGHEL
ncbi:MAG: ornithine carbamoyltransferase [Actinomycetales bacterium]|nr:ornithine carbamoyltransferase [Actinomycetales bacterium]MBP8881938.1 ornithine carbamoyltransferase [Dermatophilaceae bacterium]